MDFSALFMDAAMYTQDAFWGRWKYALKLLVSLILFPFFFGYITQVLRGEDEVPPVEWSRRSFSDGIKYLLISLFYSVPAMVAGIVLFGYVLILYEDEGVGAIEPILPEILSGFLVVLIVYVLLALFSNIALVRFARGNSFFAAFSFSRIWELIDRVGFWDYVAALVLVSAFCGAIGILLASIPYAGIVLALLASPPMSVFQARYFSQIYDLATEGGDASPHVKLY